MRCRRALTNVRACDGPWPLDSYLSGLRTLLPVAAGLALGCAAAALLETGVYSPRFFIADLHFAVMYSR